VALFFLPVRGVLGWAKITTSMPLKGIRLMTVTGGSGGDNLLEGMDP